jgi:hypothetical protein
VPGRGRKLRLALTERGLIRHGLKTRYRDRTTHVIFEPEDFVAKFARERANPTDLHRRLSELDDLNEILCW